MNVYQRSAAQDNIIEYANDHNMQGDVSKIFTFRDGDILTLNWNEWCYWECVWTNSNNVINYDVVLHEIYKF